MEEETFESGPIPLNMWDTRNRTNSRWCNGCKKWLSLSTISWIVSMEDKLEYHQKEYCKNHPDYNPTPESQ